jgi:hypothetical protein
MTRPRITTIASAALSSAAAFFVLTRSGLAGTLAGAAVASMVYTGTSHWAGQGLERAVRWWLSRRGHAPEAVSAQDIEPGKGPEAGARPGGDAARAPELTALRPAAPYGALGRLARTWGPVALAVVALTVSAFSLVTGSPLERVIVRERVVETPVDRVVVQTETVTVTVPVSGGQQPGTSVTSPLGADGTTTSTGPAGTTDSSTTTTSSVTTTSTTVPPPPTTTTALRPTTTTAASPTPGG